MRACEFVCAMSIVSTNIATLQADRLRVEITRCVRFKKCDGQNVVFSGSDTCIEAKNLLLMDESTSDSNIVFKLMSKTSPHRKP